MKRLFCCLCCVLFFQLSGGMLEDLEADVHYLWKEYESVRRMEKTSHFRTEYLGRMRLAQDRAYKIQQMAESLGINGMDLQTNLTEMLYFSQLTKSHFNPGKKGSRGYYYGELVKQIGTLKKLKFSYEQKMFTRPQYSGAGEKSALKEFEKQFNYCIKFAMKKRIYSEAMMKTFEETRIKPFLSLGDELVQEQLRQNRNMPDDYNLHEHLAAFEKAFKRVAHEMKRQNNAYLSDLKKGKVHEGYRKPNSDRRARQMKETTEYRKAWEILDVTNRRIARDIELLKEAGIDKPMGVKDVVKPMRGEEKQQNDRWIQTFPSGRTGKSRETVLANYKKILSKCFSSESTLNGISGEHYSRYRSKLPPRLAQKLDSEYKRLVNKHYPENMARKSAVLAVHSRCCNAELKFFTKEEFRFMENVKED